MKNGLTKTAALLVAMALATVARPAEAGTPATEAEALIRQGVQLRTQGKPARALPLFEKAYQTSRTPRTAAQLGLVELELGYAVEAERYLTEALASPEHPWIAKNRATLQRQLETARAGIGELAITGKPAGAEVWLNGKPAGRLPLEAPLRLDEGRVQIQVRAPGYGPATETVAIAGGKREERAFALLPDPAVARAPTSVEGTKTAGLAAPTSGDGAAAPAGTTASSTLVASGTTPENRSGTLRPYGWIAGGVALGALAFGTIEAFNAASKRDAFNNHTGDVGGVVGNDCATAALSPACKPLKDSYDQALRLSVVGFVATGALAAGAAVLFLLSSPEGNRSGEPEGSARAFGCVPNPATRGLACSLRF